MGLALHVQVYSNNQLIGEYQFDGDQTRTVKIGRMKSAQLKLEDPTVGRIHAVIECSGDGASLVDMGSTTGTFRNGEKINKVKLNHCDRVKVGNTEILVGIGGPPVVAPSSVTAVAQPGMMPGGPGMMAGAPGLMVPGQPGAAMGQMPAVGMPGYGMAPGGMPSPMAVQPGGTPGMPSPNQPPAGQMVTGMPSPRQMPGVMPSPGQVPGFMPSPGQMPGVMPSPGQMPAAGAPGMQGAAPDSSPGAAPAQPRYDGGGQQPARRATRDRVFSAAVEARPHPSLPPEQKINNNNRLLEMRSYWGDVLLSVHHYTQPKVITLGEAKGTDFFISSEGLPVEVFPIVRFEEGEYVLTFTKHMDGEIEIEGTSHTLDTLRGSSLARKEGTLEDSYKINLGMKSRALVHWGGATFALRFVPPVNALPPQLFQSLDLQYINVFVLSLFAHIATLATMMWYPHDADALRMDLFDDDANRFANIILKGPEKNDSTEDLLERLKKQVEEKKEKLEKKVEEKKQPEKLEQTKVKVVKREKTEQQKKQEVKQRFTKMFASASGAGGGSLLGGGGGGTLAGTLSNVIGTAGSGSATAGLAGLGIRGTGPMTGGGIGTSRGIAGIGTAGRAGGGGLAYGSGIGIGKKKDRGMISLSTPVVMGALPREVIQKVIDQNKAQVRYCYEVELQRNQNLEGRVMMSWIIAATGRVSKVKVRESTMNSDSVEKCIGAKIKTWVFPAPSGGGIVEVNYPFVFRAG